MNLSKIAVKRPVTTTMVILIAIVFGILSIINLKMDLLPNMNIPVAVVMTTYQGAGPEEIENLITAPIEAAVGTVSGVDEISSSSSNGSSMVIVQFTNDTDLDNAALDLRESVDMIKGMLPDDANAPMVIKIDINSMNSLMIGINGTNGDLVDLKRIVDDKIANRIERQDGVGSVTVTGGLETEITLTLNDERMRGFGVTESAISGILAAENRSLPAGEVNQGDKKMQVRVTGEYTSLEDIKSLPITTGAGRIIYLRDIAEVEETFKENSSYSYINGEPSVMLTIQKSSNANVVNVSDRVLKEFDRIKEEYPDLTVTVIMDPAEYIRTALNNVFSSAMQGGLIAVLVLYVFLRNYRSTLIVAVAMPVSIITTFALMYYVGITLNMMSLGGLTLGVGMLVDNSVVVLESIFRKIQEGDDPKTASIEGAREVAMSVTASTLTTVAVFLPISFAGGLTAQIFNELSITIACSLLASLAVSLTFVPMACSLILKPEHVRGEHKRVNIFVKFLDSIGRSIEALENNYGKLLGACLRKRKTTVLISMAFVVLTFMTLPFVGMEFFPATDEGSVSISVSMPKGTVLSETDKVVAQVVRAIENEPEIETVSYTLGGNARSLFMGGSSDSGSITVDLVPKKDRTRSAQQIAHELPQLFTHIAGAEITVSAEQGSMGSFGGGVTLQIKGDDLQTLTEIALDFKDIVAEVDGVTDVTTSVEDSTPQATIKINRLKASSLGISATSISNIVNTAVSGTVATTYKIDGDEYDIRIRQEQGKTDYITDIENILIPSALGIHVPLSEIAEVDIEDMPVSISRSNQQKYVSVTVTSFGRDSGSISDDIRSRLQNYIMPANYTYEFTGSQQQMEETFTNLGFALLMALLLVYMIMAAEFESLIYPFIVMFSIPIAITGGLFGLFVMRNSLSVTGFLGFIMLAGVVINNAIVLIDYTNLLIRERNMSMLDALRKAGPVRLRPILMTTLTTVMAMIPMMTGTSEGSEMMRGLAIVVVFGLSLSTMVTLLFIPVVYVIVSNFKMKIGNFRNKFKKNVHLEG